MTFVGMLSKIVLDIGDGFARPFRDSVYPLGALLPEPVRPLGRDTRKTLRGIGI